MTVRLALVVGFARAMELIITPADRRPRGGADRPGQRGGAARPGAGAGATPTPLGQAGSSPGSSTPTGRPRGCGGRKPPPPRRQTMGRIVVSQFITVDGVIEDP